MSRIVPSLPVRSPNVEGRYIIIHTAVVTACNRLYFIIFLESNLTREPLVTSHHSVGASQAVKLEVTYTEFRGILLSPLCHAPLVFALTRISRFTPPHALL